MDQTQEVFENWKSHSNSDKAGIKDALESFKSIDNTDLDSILQKETRNVFSQFDCLQCANCCKTTPPIFLKSDVKRIAIKMKMPPKIFIKKYLLEDIDGTLIGNGVPCTFLNDDNTCAIYEIRPIACRGYPHTDEKGFKYRNSMNYRNTEICPAAFQIIQNVKRALKK
jgi:Fe-S-cluster containining protein